MTGLNVGLVIGAILNRKNNNPVSQPGGILLYGGTLIFGFLIGLNSLAWAMNLDNPPHPVWSGAALIWAGTIVVLVAIQQIRKYDRKCKLEELNKKRSFYPGQLPLKH
jgi:peptidoglycan/LPS O-acetylase OafA/YrhL